MIMSIHGKNFVLQEETDRQTHRQTDKQIDDNSIRHSALFSEIYFSNYLTINKL